MENEHLKRYERKVLCRIFGPVEEVEVWRRQMNGERDPFIMNKNVVRFITSQRDDGCAASVRWKR